MKTDVLAFCSRVVFFSSIASIVGVGLGSIFFDAMTFVWIALTLFFVSTLVALYSRQTLLSLSITVAVMACFALHTQKHLENVAIHAQNEPFEVHEHARIVSIPQQSTNAQRLTVEFFECTETLPVCEKNVRALLVVSPYEEFFLGETFTVRCKFAPPKNFTDEFNWQMFLAKDSIFYSCYRPEITNRASPENNARTMLASWRRKLEDGINKTIPQPHAALANGLLFGGDNRLSEETNEQFKKTGMSHIVAVSGSNVTMIAGFFTAIGIACGLWRKHAVILAVLAIIAFVAMIGMPPSGVRAGIMGILMLIAIMWGKVSLSIRMLAITGAFMLFWNPLLLLHDIGFQLSFLASLGIITIIPFVQQRLQGYSPGIKVIGSMMAVTVSAQIFVLPVTLYHFHTFPTLSLAANMLVLPGIPFTMLLAFGTALTSMFFEPLSMILGWSANILLWWEMYVIKVIAEVPWSSVTVEFWGIGWSILTLCLLFGVVGVVHKKHTHKKNSPLKTIFEANKTWGRASVLFLGGVVGILGSVAVDMGAKHDTTVSFLNVGQGDAILIQNGFKQVLIDGGPNATILMEQLGEHIPFWDRTLDVVIATHPDADHIGGLVGVEKYFTVPVVLQTSGEQQTDVHEMFTQNLELSKTTIMEPTRDLLIYLQEDIALRVVSPEAKDEQSTNEQSIVTLLTVGEETFLFTGDIYTQQEEELNVGDVTVLKAAHHGSKTSTSSAFLEEIHPRDVVISVGKENRYNHPHEEILERINHHHANIARTDIHGTITYTCKKDQLCTIETTKKYLSIDEHHVK